MAINNYEICDSSSLKDKISGTSSCRMVDFGPEPVIHIGSRRGKIKKSAQASFADKLQLLSQFTEREVVHAKSPIKSSFPLAANIYKASSDEFRALKRSNRKVRKSVLTLPNEPSPRPQTCTVSDANESDYGMEKLVERGRNVVNKKRPSQKKVHIRSNNFIYYDDRDARHCSQLNIDLDCSSTDLSARYGGDGVRGKQKSSKENSANRDKFQGHDVWTVLRNINRFQFRPSPRISEESVVIGSTSTKRKRNAKKIRVNRKERRVIQTCRTQKISYIANFHVDSKTSSTISPSSSMDRVTVIDNGENQMLRNQIMTDANQSGSLAKINDKDYYDTYNIYSEATKKKSKESCMACNESMGSSNDYPRVMFQTENNSKKKHRHEDSYENMNLKRNNRHDDSYGNMAYKATERDNHLPITSGVEKHKEKKSTGSAYLGETSQNFANDGLTRIQRPHLQVKVNRKPRLVTTMPSAAVIPHKLTCHDVKRRMAHYKFPIIITGKEQIRGTIELQPFNFDQFAGLDDHIWPFMAKWDPRNTSPDKLHRGFYRQETLKWKFNKKTINDVITNCNNSLGYNKKKDDHLKIQRAENKHVTNVNIKHITNIENKHVMPLQQNKKPKSMRQLSDNMLRFLYKKSNEMISRNREHHESTDTFVVGKKIAAKELSPGVTKKFNMSTETAVKSPSVLKKELNEIPTKKNTPTIMCRRPVFAVEHNTASSRRPAWGKSKWANEFIENVISKISNGAYYRQDTNMKLTASIKDITDVTEETAQPKRPTVVSSNINDDKEYKCLCQELKISEDIEVKSNEPLPAIPGFENTLPELEVETLNFNQIAVKHCSANIMIQFDVTGPKKIEPFMLNTKQSLSCIPAETSEPVSTLAIKTHSTAFKCKTTIFNAMLPAELCTVIPQLMRQLINSEGKITFVSPNNSFHLPTLSEVTHSKRLMPVILPFILSPELIKHRRGRYSGNKPTTYSKVTFVYTTDLALSFSNISAINGILTTVPVKCTVYLVADINYLPLKPVKETPSTTLNTLDDQLIHTQPSNCTDVQVYTGYNKYQNIYSPSDNFMDLMKKVMDFCNMNLSPLGPLNLLYDMNNNTIHVKIHRESSRVAIEPFRPAPKKLTVTIDKVKINSIFNRFVNRIDSSEECNTNSQITDLESLALNKVKERNTMSKKGFVGFPVPCKSRRRGFVKLYKKCKSTSNISSEKCSTPINKISNVDDFLQSLGSGKLLASVLDGCAEQKLLTCITQMKSWVNDLTPRQALLVLLLANKKDTPNLYRFRPILLQGIAVNRITRSSELDMEIEVIETENFKLSAYEGISYLPSAVVNRDNLLEELCWIAKTTASDYQKPFDESSEMLLKDLLAKRKKLNPSYLRVMARYVGLGVLKPPTKKN